jgi:hypothetical protein
MSGKQNTGLADVDHITFADLEQHDRRLRVCPDWTQEHITGSGFIGLTNDVHPLFEASRFGPGFSLQDTEQARRFASRLLEVDCVLPFWWALMSSGTTYGSESEEQEANTADIRTWTLDEARSLQSEMDDSAMRMQQARTPDSELSLYDPPEALTSGQIDKTKADLRELARYIYYAAEENADGSRCETNWHLRVSPPFRGSPSRIVISAEELRLHSAAMEGDVVCQAGASISLGFRFLQLLGHAAVGAARSGPNCHWSTKYRFDADPIIGSEIRMLECCTFGGLIRREQELEQVARSHYTINGAEGVPGLWFAYSDWPGMDIWDMLGSIPGDEDEQLWQEDNGPFYHHEWQVSFFWLLSLLSDRFWDVDVSSRGQAALKPPMEIGYVMHRDDKRKYGPLHSADLRDGAVPEGYSILPRSYVMVKDHLFHEGCRAGLFGDLGLERMTTETFDHEMDVDDVGSGSSAPGMTESVSDSDSDNDIDIDGDDNIDGDSDSDSSMEIEWVDIDQ